MKLWTALLAALLITGCASYSGSGLTPGVARLEDVQALMGAPAMRWQDPDGSVQLAYPRGPLGRHTFMVNLGPDGRLLRIANVLESNSFARIRPGMSQDEVLRVLGPPNYGRSVYYAARDELVWDWRICSDYGVSARFNVLFDNTSGAVRNTMIQPEYHGRLMMTESCGP